MVPSPSCPPVLAPQQWAAPLGVDPQVCTAPTLMTAKVRPPATSWGLVLVLFVPSPNWPNELSPQQYAALVLVTAQL
jgi:hypothetical protein